MLQTKVYIKTNFLKKELEKNIIGSEWKGSEIKTLFCGNRMNPFTWLDKRF